MLTIREKFLLESLAATAGVSVSEMTAILTKKYPELTLGYAIRKEVDRM